MKPLFDNLLTLALALVLGLSPIQNIAASTSKCMNKDQSMHHQMNTSAKVTHSDMTHANNKKNCCEKNACDMSHCASTTIAALITSNTQDSISYTVSNVYFKPAVSLIQFYPSSLYRPPRV